MYAQIKAFLQSFLQVDPYERLKLFLLSLCFAFIVGAYSVLHSLKPAVFAAIVGIEYQPYTQWCSIALVAPFMVLFSFMVNRLKQYQLIYYLCTAYAIVGIFFAVLLLQPSLGLQNTTPHPSRLLGWTFYVFVDFYQIIIISTFWAFSNTINSPDNAKKNYGIMVACSKIAGGLAAFSAGSCLKLGHRYTVDAAHIIPFIVLAAALLLLIAALLAAYIMRRVPQAYLHGYEAAYQADQHHTTKEKVGFLEGLKMMAKHPYVLGIFVMVYCYEIINSILDYQMHQLMWKESGGLIDGMSASMLNYTATFQGIGFLLALFGTTSLLRYLDVKICLLLMPFVATTLIGIFVFHPTLQTIFIVMVALRAIHYSFDTPVREILYIPTVKAIRFKSKAWIDSFGRTMSKTSASVFNLSVRQVTSSPVVAGSIFTAAIAGFWLFIAFGMARKYTNTVSANRVIGDGEEPNQA